MEADLQFSLEREFTLYLVEHDFERLLIITEAWSVTT